MRRKSYPGLTNRSNKLKKQNPQREVPGVFQLQPENIRDGIIQINDSPIITIANEVLVHIP